MTESPKLDLSLRPLIALLPLLPLLSLPAIISQVGGEFSGLSRVAIFDRKRVYLIRVEFRIRCLSREDRDSVDFRTRSSSVST